MRPKTYRVNDNYFKKWSHNMAYILGLWFSDGCITSKSVFAITLHERDRKLLQDVLAEMASNHVVTKNRRCSVIRINSADIYNDIIKLGGKERKSLDCRFPNVPSEYLPGFIRGLWDGDGCITNSKWRGYDYYRASLYSGSKQFMCDAKRIINTNIPLTKGSIGTRTYRRGTKVNGCVLKRDSVVYVLSLGINDTRRLRDYIYCNDGLKMGRKYDKFVEAGDIKFHKPVTTADYETASKYSWGLKLNSKNEWFQYFRKHTKPNYIPANPYERYKNCGWVNWASWLGNKDESEKFEV